LSASEEETFGDLKVLREMGVEETFEDLKEFYDILGEMDVGEDGGATFEELREFDRMLGEMGVEAHEDEDEDEDEP
jgi:hypothetical protein